LLVAQLSDTHILTPASDPQAAALRADCLRRVVLDVNRQRPDVVIFTGDTVQHGRPDEYAVLRELLEPLTPPLFVVPGNRDDKTVLQKSFPDHPHFPGGGEFCHYAIEQFGLRIVGLDSTLAGERKGRFCAARQAWLDSVLGERPERPTLLFLHHPPFDVGDHYVGGYRQSGEAGALADIVARHPQVAALFCGHVHWMISREWAGAQARIMPSVAIDLRHGVDEVAARGRPVWMLHRFDPRGGLVSELRMAA